MFVLSGRDRRAPRRADGVSFIGCNSYSCPVTRLPGYPVSRDYNEKCRMAGEKEKRNHATQRSLNYHNYSYAPARRIVGLRSASPPREVAS